MKETRIIKAITNQLPGRRFSWLIVLLLFQGKTIAQDFSLDMKTLNEYYSTSENLAFQLKVKSFKTAQDKGSIQNAFFQKRGLDFRYKVEDTEMLVTSEALVLINHYNKRIIYRTISAEERKRLLKESYQAGLDSITSRYDSVGFDLKNPGDKHYTIYNAKKSISKTELWMNKQAKGIGKMEYYYNSSVYKKLYKVEIVFESIPESNRLRSDSFTVGSVLVKQGKEFKPAAPYKGYVVMIQNL